MNLIHKLFLLIMCAQKIQHGPKCRLNTRINFGEPLPVILRDGRLLEPSDKFGNIEMNYGDTLTLSCEGGNIQHPNVQQVLSVATINCDGGDMFKNEEWLNSPGQFSSFRCIFPPQYKSERTERTCYDNNPIIEVGYRIDSQFYPVYETCFNEVSLNPIYSKYTQKPYNAMFQTRVDRPYFIADDNYGYIPVNSLFSPGGLRAAVARQVGGSVIDNYFTKTELLSRGHLAAKTDFVFAFTERATFHYVNCAPQWKGFNGGNWNTLEVDLRNHIHHASYDTIIYTGTFGLTQLNNDMGRQVDIHLYTDENNNPVIPVPQFFYKVVYESSSKRGVAFIGINNPYCTLQEARQMFFCNDVCRGNRDFSWLSWHPDNPEEGYTFCCTVDDFRRTVPHLPPFQVDSLLT